MHKFSIEIYEKIIMKNVYLFSCIMMLLSCNIEEDCSNKNYDTVSGTIIDLHTNLSVSGAEILIFDHSKREEVEVNSNGSGGFSHSGTDCSIFNNSEFLRLRDVSHPEYDNHYFPFYKEPNMNVYVFKEVELSIKLVDIDPEIEINPSVSFTYTIDNTSFPRSILENPNEENNGIFKFQVPYNYPIELKFYQDNVLYRTDILTLTEDFEKVYEYF